MKYSKRPDLGHYLSRLYASPVGRMEGRTLWRLHHPLVFHCKRYEYTHTVKSGSLTDYSSIPRLPFVWLIFSDHGHEAGALHDDLWNDPSHTRKVANWIFYDALLVSGVPRWRAWLMFKAVQIAAAVKQRKINA